jgi:non-lysosomal glucosylceramidase
VPLEVRIEAFTPFVPGDADQSGIPAAILRFVLTNPTKQPVTASVCGCLQNFIGTDGAGSALVRNYNRFRQEDGAAPIQGVALVSAGVDPHAKQFGTLALATSRPRCSARKQRCYAGTQQRRGMGLMCILLIESGQGRDTMTLYWL